VTSVPGSNASLPRSPSCVRFPPDRDQIAGVWLLPFCEGGNFSVMDAEPYWQAANLQPEAHVGRICGTIAILVLLLVSPAFGQYVAVIETCSRDVEKSCAPDRQERSRLIQCTEAHFQDFNEQCQAALVKIGAVSEACKVDIREQCPGVKPGSGRILLCVKEHFAALSEACKDAIGHAAERKVGAH
jgi:hypothetical protein